MLCYAANIHYRMKSVYGTIICLYKCMYFDGAVRKCFRYFREEDSTERMYMIVRVQVGHFLHPKRPIKKQMAVCLERTEGLTQRGIANDAGISKKKQLVQHILISLMNYCEVPKRRVLRQQTSERKCLPNS